MEKKEEEKRNEHNRTEEMEEKREIMALRISATPFTFVVHALGLVGFILVLVWTLHFRGGLAWDDSNKNLIFNLHPVLMLTGVIVLGGEAIISYKSLPLSKDRKKLTHLILHAIALVLGIVGVYTVFKYHIESGIPNLYSLHSWFGISVIVLYAIQWLYGFLTFFFPGGSDSLTRESLPWHVVFGTFVYLLAVATAALGFLEKLTFLQHSGVDRYGSEAFLVNFTAIVTVLFGAFVIFCRSLGSIFYR